MGLYIIGRPNRSVSTKSVFLRDGKEHYRNGEYEEAARLLRTALRIEPDAPEALIYLGFALGELGDGAGARRCFKRLLESNPENEAYDYLALYFAGEGKYTRAEMACRKAIEKNPRDCVAWNNLAIWLVEESKHQEAVMCSRMALSIDDARAEFWLNLGVGLASLGKWQDAREAFERSVGMQPALIEGWLDLGLCLLRSGDVDGARAAYHKAIEADPKSADAHFHVGALHMERRELKGAVQHFERAVALDPSFREAWLNLAVCSDELGKLDRAVECAQMALGLDEEDQRVKNLLESLKEAVDFRRRHDLTATNVLELIRTHLGERALAAFPVPDDPVPMGRWFFVILQKGVEGDIIVPQSKGELSAVLDGTVEVEFLWCCGLRSTLTREYLHLYDLRTHGRAVFIRLVWQDIYDPAAGPIAARAEIERTLDLLERLENDAKGDIVLVNHLGDIWTRVGDGPPQKQE